MPGSQLYMGCSYADLIIRAIERTPDMTAIVDRNESLTYRQLGDRISQYIQVFEAAGIKPGDGVTQLTTNRIDAFTTCAAAYIYGLPYTPMHPMGGLDDQLFILEDAEIKAIVIDAGAFEQRGRELIERAPHISHVFTMGPSDLGTDIIEEAARRKPVPLTTTVTEDDIIQIAYTGGTTGRPKGIIHNHKTFVTSLLMSLAEMEWPRVPRLLLCAPISHASGFLVLPAFLKGGMVVLEPGFEPTAFLETVQRHRISVTFAVPTMIYLLLDHPRLSEYDYSSLELIFYGGAPISPTRIQSALEVFGQVFRQHYANYELPMNVLGLSQKAHDSAHPERFSSCGMPLTGIQVKLLDEDCREVPVGEVGEICVRGRLVMQGYWKRPQETAEAFRGDWLHTGDMALRDSQGYFHIVDRKKDMIVSGGFNVYSREVEDVLTAHPAVAGAAVIGIPDPKWGESVMAFIVMKPGQDVAPEELQRLVKEKKGSIYAPKQIEFADSLPLTSLGKLDKKRLRSQFWEGQERQVS